MKVLTTIFFLCFLHSGLQGQSFATRSELDSLFSLYSPGKPDTQQVWILSRLSHAFAFKNPDSGLLFAVKEMELSKSMNYEKGEADARVNMAVNWWSVGEYSVSIKLLTETEQYHKRIKDLQGLSIIYRRFISLYRDQGDFAQALAYLNAADSMAQVLGWCDKCIDSLSLGSIYFDMERYDSAMTYLKVVENNNYKYPWSNLMLGKAYAKKGNSDKAKQYYLVSIEGLTNDNNFKDLAGAYNSMADLYRSLQMKDSAIYYANKGLELTQQNKFTKERLQSYLILSTIYNTLDPKLSLDYLKLAFATKDTLYSQDKQRQISAHKFSEELDRQKAEDLEKQYRGKLRMAALFAVLGLLAVISIILYRSNRHKEVAKKKVEYAYEKLKATQQQLIQSEKMASLGELTAGIAHEIQNPLNFVNNFSEVNVELTDEIIQSINKGNLENATELALDIRSNQEKIREHGKRADAIVKSMLQHSRTNTGHKELKDLNLLADEYLRLSYHGMRAKDKSFNSDFELISDPNLPLVNIIPPDIGRVLLNIINNAFYAVNEKRKISDDEYKAKVTVALSKAPESGTYPSEAILISISDNGTGIPDKVKEKIFQPFFTTKPTGEGTGLGLSLSYDIITKGHGGELNVLTSPEGMATFQIKLPVG